MPRKQLYVILLIALLALPTITQAQLGQPNILDETTVTISDLQVTVNATGEITPWRTVPLAFGTSGTVQEVLVQPGQSVQAGDVLARVDAREMELALRNAEITLRQQQLRYEQLTAPARDVDLAAAEAALISAQASLNAAYATGSSANEAEIARLQVEVARNQLWQAQVQRDQALALNPEFRISPTNDPEVQETLLNASLQQADIGIRMAQTQYDGSLNRGPDQGRISQANAAILQASIQLNQLANGPDEYDRRMAEIALENSALAVEQLRLQLEEAQITAPFDGLITQSNLVVGQLPPADQPAIELVSTTSFIVDLMIDETDVVYLTEGMKVNFNISALPEATVTGAIDEISILPLPGSTVPMYRARVQLDPTLEPIRVGMSVTASVVLEEVTDALIVPNRFITLNRATQQATITILDENNYIREVPVTLGEQNTTHTQVLSGVTAGQRIVVLDRSELLDS